MAFNNRAINLPIQKLCQLFLCGKHRKWAIYWMVEVALLLEFKGFLMVPRISRDECLWKSLSCFWSVFKNVCLGTWCTCFSLCELLWEELLSISTHEILTNTNKNQLEDKVNSQGLYGYGCKGNSSYLSFWTVF